jgi:hypothetical protein
LSAGASSGGGSKTRRGSQFPFSIADFRLPI